jgi:HEAT repeat protein
MMERPTFRLHSSDDKRRGSKVLSAVFVIGALAVVGGGVVFWFDRGALLRHVAERDRLATPAAWVLYLQTPPAEAQQPLVDALQQGTEPGLRAAAARALGEYRSRDLVAELGDAAVRDPDPGVRRAAVMSLDRIGTENAASFVRHALVEDDDPDVQAAACSAVATLELYDMIPPLIDRLASTSIPLRQAAKKALDRFLPPGEVSKDFDRVLWHTWYDGLRRPN